MDAEHVNPPDWRALLQAAVDTAGRGGKAAVAKRLGISRPYVSRVLSSGRSGLASVPPEFIDRVLRRLHVVACPARAGHEVSYRDCLTANQPAPTHNPIAVMVWRTCQTCPNKPEGDRS